MKIFEKKVDDDSLHTLNEKEIQKRLYGRYHLESNSKATALETPSPNPTRLEIPKAVTSSVVSTSFKDFLARSQKVLLLAGKKFPWTFATIVISALALSVISLQVLSIWFGKMKPPEPSEISVATGEANRFSQAKKVPEVKAFSSSPALSPPTAAGSALTAQLAEGAKKKYYAVQVCTYQKEQDAARLATELKASNFDAFYLRMASSRQRQPHYVVFLGKEESYLGANSKLDAFRKSRYYEQFSDSFIRSI
ncbi:MAG: SPOR domain-containing protein [Candidatus Omnitrophica bacterium]|nr:SPOR domain-containing protein [Candidatus Omnitrophota bacterium]